MKIDEVISFYAFLSNINLLGFLSILIVVNLLVYISLFALSQKPSQKVVVSVILILSFALSILYYEARERNRLMILGNDIKQNLFARLFKQTSFSDIIAEPNNKNIKEDDLKKLQNHFPHEFLVVNLNKESGICLIETNTIEKINAAIKEKAQKTGRLVVNYLKATGQDTLLINEPMPMQCKHCLFLESLDYQGWLIGQDFFKLLPNESLYPVYDKFYNITGFCLIKIPNEN